jgi:hypothetical protein
MGKYAQYIDSFVNSKIANATTKQMNAYTNLKIFLSILFISIHDFVIVFAVVIHQVD